MKIINSIVCLLGLFGTVYGADSGPFQLFRSGSNSESDKIIRLANYFCVDDQHGMKYNFQLFSNLINQLDSDYLIDSVGDGLGFLSPVFEKQTQEIRDSIKKEVAAIITKVESANQSALTSLAFNIQTAHKNSENKLANIKEKATGATWNSLLENIIGEMKAKWASFEQNPYSSLTFMDGLMRTKVKNYGRRESLSRKEMWRTILQEQNKLGVKKELLRLQKALNEAAMRSDLPTYLLRLQNYYQKALTEDQGGDHGGARRLSTHAIKVRFDLAVDKFLKSIPEYQKPE